MPTIHDIAITPNVLPAILTESSSSGSVTESVCTSYETPKGGTSRPDSCLEIRTIQEEENTAVKTDNKTDKSGLISSIFEGL